MRTGIAIRRSTALALTITTLTITIILATGVPPVSAIMTGLVAAGTASASDHPSGISCVRLFPLQGREVLINGCDVCRRVGVERDRPGAQFPTTRTVIVPEQSRIELSFLGPGRTRVTSEEECRAAASAEPDTGRSDGRRCVQFARSGGTHLLVNGCGECRAIAVVRTDTSGQQSYGSYLVGPRSALPYPLEGAQGAAIAEETNCH